MGRGDGRAVGSPMAAAFRGRGGAFGGHRCLEDGLVAPVNGSGQ
jgi:hypothetical protein